MKKIWIMLFALLCGATNVFAGIAGDTVSAVYLFPDSSSVYSPYGNPPNAVVGNGVEFAGSGNAYPFSYFDVDLSDLGVVITFLNDAPYSGGSQSWESSISFNGLELINLTKSFDPSELSLSSHSLVSFDWGGNTLSFNWKGVHFLQGDQIIVTSTNVIPEPPSGALLFVGLLVSTVLRRLRFAEIRLASRLTPRC